MTTDNVTSKVQKVLKALGVEVQNDMFDRPLRELGIDSLKTMDLVLSLEDAFLLQVPEEELVQSNLDTTKAIIALFTRLTK